MILHASPTHRSAIITCCWCKITCIRQPLIVLLFSAPSPDDNNTQPPQTASRPWRSAHRAGRGQTRSRCINVKPEAAKDRRPVHPLPRPAELSSFKSRRGAPKPRANHRPQVPERPLCSAEAIAATQGPAGAVSRWPRLGALNSGGGL